MLHYYITVPEDTPPIIELRSGIPLLEIARRPLEEKSPSDILNLIESSPLLSALDLKINV